MHMQMARIGNFRVFISVSVTGMLSKIGLPASARCVKPVTSQAFRAGLPDQRLLWTDHRFPSAGLTDGGRLCTVPVPMPKATVQPESPTLNFEAAMSELESLVERLEGGDLPLEDSLKTFERGVALTRSCQLALKEAEQKVEVLLKKAGQPSLESFTQTTDD